MRRLILLLALALIFLLAAATVSAQLDSYTKLLLHMDGTDGSQIFIDETGKAVTANGNAQIDTAQYMFGGASGLFDGNGDYLTLADSDDWNFGSGDFTIDFWIMTTGAVGDWRGVIAQGDDPYNGNWMFLMIPQYSTNSAYFVFSSKADGNVNVITWYIDNTPWTDNIWHHIAIVRSGNTWYFFIDGISKTITLSYGAWACTLPDVAKVLDIGYTPLSGGHLYGWIDELRISKGIARIPVLSCTNITQPGKYFLAQNINNWNSATNEACINISVSNVELDCQGFAIDGVDRTGTSGILTDGTTSATLSNIAIKNCRITDFSNGIKYDYTKDSTIINSTLSSNSGDGIYISSGSNNNVTNVSLSSNGDDGIYLDSTSYNNLTRITSSNNVGDGIYISSSPYNTLRNFDITKAASKGGIYVSSTLQSGYVQNIDNSNLVNGRAVQYFDGVTKTCPNGQTLDYGSTYSHLTLVSCNNVIAKMNADDIIMLAFTSYSVIQDSTLTGSRYGIFLRSGTYNAVTNVSISNAYGGMYLSASTRNTIANSTISDNLDDGVYVTSGSDYNNFTSLTLFNNDNGIALYDGARSIIHNITSFNNLLDGIDIASLSDYTTVTDSYLFRNGDEGISIDSDLNRLINITISENDGNGIYFGSNNNARNEIINSTIRDNKQYGIDFYRSAKNNITGSRIENNSVSGYAGLYFSSPTASSTTNATKNRLWNNIINNTLNLETTGINSTNYFNTTLTAGTNILGGNFIAGNYWRDYSGSDGNSDGIGDVPYVINGTYMKDFLPLLFSGGSGPSNEISSCTNITQPGSYKLTQSITNWNGGDGTNEIGCVKINASNVELDCQGFTIDGVDKGSTYGVFAKAEGGSPISNITIKNCYLRDWGPAVAGFVGAGIGLKVANNSFISNITIESSFYGIYFTSFASYNNVTNVNILQGSSIMTSEGIRLDSFSNNNTFTKINISNTSDGFYISSDSNNLTNIIVFNNTRGVSVVAGSYNSIFAVSASNGGYGIYSSSGSYYNNFTNINASSNAMDGIHLGPTSDSNILTNIEASHNLGNGLYLQQTSYNAIINLTSSYNLGDGITLMSANTTIRNSNILNNEDDGIWAGWSGAVNNTFINVVVSESAEGQSGIFMTGYYNTLINVTASSNKGDGISIGSYSQIINSTIRDNRFDGLYLQDSRFNNITGSRIENNSNPNYAGIAFYSPDPDMNSSYNRLWNNIINNTPNGGRNWRIREGQNYTNYFNTTQYAGTNILGGNFIAGNYWSDYSGSDGNSDGIGDTPYIINTTYMKDGLPLFLSSGGTPPQPPASNWMHIAVTYSSSTHQKRIYINGVLKKTEAISSSGSYTINNPSVNVYLSALRGISGIPFNGTIDDIKVYSASLTQDKIMQEYSNELIFDKLPQQNEANTFTLPGEDVQEVSIAPIVRVGNKEKICSATTRIKLPVCA